MRTAYKSWLGAGLIGLLLSACTTTEETTQAPVQQPQYNGPVVEIGGAEPRYEPYNPGTSQDYRVKGQTYKIVKNPQNFSQVGLATWYGEEVGGNTTATGETFDPNALTAAHPTLPLPSYVRVTNLANGRQIVVRLNDRGPYTSGRIIDLSRAAAERLNISNNTKVRVDFINVAPDGSLSGPGTVGTTVAKQSFALPERPAIGQGSTQVTMEPSGSGSSNVAIRPVVNSAPVSADNDMPVTSPSSRSSGFLGAPQPLPSGVLEGSEPAAVPDNGTVQQLAAISAGTAAVSGGYLVQVGALSDGTRAASWQQTLSQQFGVPGKVAANGAVYRVQLGPFASRQQAVEVQQRLQNEAQQQSFIVAAQ